MADVDSGGDVRYRDWIVGWADYGQEGREAVTERCHASPGRVVCGLGVHGVCARRWKVASGQ